MFSVLCVTVRIILDSILQSDQIKAAMEDGVLTATYPKAAPQPLADPQKITIA